jgi:hypothetical protein
MKPQPTAERIQVFAAPLILLLLLIPAWVIWVVLLFASGPTGAILRTPRHEFLGPGGPDDPFANDPFEY